MSCKLTVPIAMETKTLTSTKRGLAAKRNISCKIFLKAKTKINESFCFLPVSNRGLGRLSGLTGLASSHRLSPLWVRLPQVTKLRTCPNMTQAVERDVKPKL